MSRLGGSVQLLVILCCRLSLTTSQQNLRSNATTEKPRFPNIVYLGMSYNILKGNPQPLDVPDIPDPGFYRAASVVDMSDFSGGYMYDNKWAIPDAVKDHIASSSACGYESTVSEAADTASYQRSISADVSLSAGASGKLWHARFTASLEYQQTEEQVVSQQQVHVYSSAVCEVYKASLPIDQRQNLDEEEEIASPSRRRLGMANPSALPLTPSFRQSVSMLPTALTPVTMGRFLSFVENWGTHLTTEIGMGGKASYVSIFTREAYSDLKAQGYHVAAAAELSFLAFSGGASVDTAEHSNDYHAFVAATHSTRQVCVGAGGKCPPKSADQDPSKWANAVMNDPLPLRYELMELWPLLSPAFFPDDPAILDRQAALVAFLADHYCGDNRDCVPTLPSKDGYWLSAANLSCSAYPDGTVTGLAAGSHGRSLYVTGGPSGALCIFDVQSNAWSKGSAMREARWEHGVVLLLDPTDPTNRLLYALGGSHPARLVGHSDGGLRSVAVTPDGRTIVSGSEGNKNTIKVWDLASGACLRTLVGHSDGVISVAITPDGRTIVSGSFDKTIKVWDLASGACLRTLVGHSDLVHSVAITSDGRTIVSGSYDTTIKVWDLASGACLRTLVGHSSHVISVAITPDGRTIVSGSYDKTIKVWDLASGACLRTLVGHPNYVDSVAITPDGRTIVSGSDDSTIKVWDLASGACLRTLVGHSDGVPSVAITPDGRTIVSGSYDKTIKVWDLASGACLRTLVGNSNAVNAVKITPDGSIVSGCYDTTIRLWYPLGSMEAYDLHDRQWVGGLASLATARSQHGVTAYLNSSILALGGLDASYRALSSVELYSSEEDRWSSFPPMTTPRAGPAVVAVPGSPVVYVFGGRDGEGRVLSSVERFNGSEWRVFGSMKRPRVGHAASLTSAGSTIHVYGGSDGDGQPQNTVEVFDAATGAWLRFGPKMNKPRGQVCADVISEAKGVETLVVVGQGGGDGRACEALTLLVE